MINNLNINLLDWFDENKNATAIFHQANCQKTMGGGIARQIKEEFPEAYDADLNYGEKGDKNKLGKFSHVFISENPKKILYNLYGQHEYGMGYRHTNYEAIYSGMEKIKLHATLEGIIDIGLPYNIGCKLGGGDWRIVEQMVNVVFEFSGFNVFVCRYEPVI